MAQNKEYEICKGCASYGSLEIFDNKEKYHRKCYVKYPVISPTSQCPCITCLLKNICHNSCEDYENYFVLSDEKEKGEHAKK